uniref:Nucleoside diphosphate kinase n=1 Tax=Oryctolagus cuniculus TaxID=9986 RepID=U3KNZ4_RABIT
MAHLERTFIAIKPDGVQRGLVGEIIKRFEQKGFRLVAMKFLRASEEHLKQHYIDLKDRPFFPGLVKYMNSGPVVAMVWEGLNVVKTGRVMLGETNPADSKPGTIRGDFCIQVGRNIIHGSDSVKSAEKGFLLKLKNKRENWYQITLYNSRYKLYELSLRDRYAMKIYDSMKIKGTCPYTVRSFKTTQMSLLNKHFLYAHQHSACDLNLLKQAI